MKDKKTETEIIQERITEKAIVEPVNLTIQGKKIFNRLEFIKELSKKYKVNIERVVEILFDAETSRKKMTKNVMVSGKEYVVTKTGIGPIRTKHGNFYQATFEIDDEWKHYSVIVKSDIEKDSMLPNFTKHKEIFLRIDSGCTSGQLFNDITCECRDQLNLTLEKFNKKEQGIIIHIPKQDGRGKGIDFKLATLYLQEHLGLNTTEAFTLLEKDNSHISLDSRNYDGVVAILKFLGATNNITIGTNNPKKLDVLKKNDIPFKTANIVIPPTEFTCRHLKAKEKILGHCYIGELS